MDVNAVIDDRVQKLEELKVYLNKIDEKLMLLAKEFKWDCKKLLEEISSRMVICSINHQHRVPISTLSVHEQKCFWKQKGYSNNDKIFPEYSGTGSFVSLTPESLHSITKNISSSTGKAVVYNILTYAKFLPTGDFNMICFSAPLYGVSFCNDEIQTNQNKSLRAVPQTSVNFDQNFDREEKLAIYNYVIANTEKQNSFSDLWLQSTEKTEEKKEMAPWEIAAAERNAKRRRASYRNKVHTNRKTNTEILREVIEAQMEALKEEIAGEEIDDRMEGRKTDHEKFSLQSREPVDKSKHRESSHRRNKEERDKSRNYDKHSKHRESKTSASYTGNDNKCRSRSHDKYRKWKTYEGRSHSHRSSHSYRR